MELKDKTVLVTGASSGIGGAIALFLSGKGAQIIVHYNSNKQGAEQVLAEVEKKSSGFVVKADLMKDGEVDEMFENISKQVSSIDVLVNNAGRARYGAFDDMKLWEHQLNNILLSAVRVTNGFLSFSKDRDVELKKIINITSVYGNLYTGNPDYFAYSAAKAAFNSITTNLAKKLGPSVLVNAVAPGYTWTPPWEGASDEEKKACTDATQTKRFIEAREVAHVVAMLAENDSMTGEIITIDGGLSLSPTSH